MDKTLADLKARHSSQLKKLRSSDAETKKRMSYRVGMAQFVTTNLLLISGMKLLIFNHYGRLNGLVKLGLFSALYYWNEPIIALSSAVPLIVDSYSESQQQ